MIISKSGFFIGSIACLLSGPFQSLQAQTKTYTPPPPLSQKKAFIIDQAWVRPSQGQNSAAYMIIKNDSVHSDQLIAAECDVCNTVELHRTEMDPQTQVYKMRPVPTLDLPAHGSLVLEPGATHIMLMGLKRPLLEGEILTVKLIFKKAAARDLKIEVKSPAGAVTEKNKESEGCACS